jgi:hypothetical protein
MENRLPVVLWLAGALALLAFPARTWIRDDVAGALSAPVTPFDRTDGAAARQWLFLRRASAVVPATASYTVVAPTLDVEMNVLMMSFGLLPEARPMPSSYYGVPTPLAGGRARFVLSYDRARVPGPLRVVAAFDEGVIYERPETE